MILGRRDGEREATVKVDFGVYEEKVEVKHKKDKEEGKEKERKGK